MKVNHYLETGGTEEVPGVLCRVVIGPEDGAPRFTMRLFEVRPGGSTPFHSHWWEHEVFILSGEGTVKGKGEEKAIGTGTVVFIAPDEEHCLVNNGKEILRFICVIPLTDAAP